MNKQIKELITDGLTTIFVIVIFAVPILCTWNYAITDIFKIDNINFLHAIFISSFLIAYKYIKVE